MSKKLNLKYANEVLEGIESLPKGSIVLLKSQTGTGKTTAILGNDKSKILGLIDKIGDKSLIYFCNRIALKRQIKIDLCNKYNIDIKRKENGKVDYEWLDRLENIKNITIMSYQTLEEKIINREIFIKRHEDWYKYNLFELNYDYIVADEFHYILSDASFNNKTRLTFKELCRKWYANSIIIYMTATDFEVKDVVEASVNTLDEMLKEEVQDFKANYYHYYDTGIDYSYLDVKYFKNYKDISMLIKNESSKDKWIWFCSSISGAKERLNLLKEYGISAEFISAKDNEELKNKIIECEEFDCKVLITTPVLDNGVNIKDEYLRNIIIEVFNPITFIQSVGRKRISLDIKDKINLYIPIRNASNFNIKINQLQGEIDLMNMFSQDYYKFKKITDYNLDKLGNGFYYDESDNLCVNEVYYSKCYRDINRYRYYADNLNTDPNFFIKEQLRWLGQEDKFSEDNLIQDVVDDKEVSSLEEFLRESYEDNIYFTKESFRETINNIINNDSKLLDIMNKLDGRNTREKGQKLYNKLFEKCNIEYLVGSVPQYEYKNGKRVKMTYWRIVKEN